MRQALWYGVIAIVLVVLGAAWFVSTHERVPEKRRVAPETEARRNPLLAFERFAQRMSYPAQRYNDPRILDSLPADGVLLLDAHRRSQMTPERLQRLLAWVSRGGYLVVQPESGKSQDPLLSRLQVEIFKVEASPGKKPPLPKTVTVEFPGNPKRLQIAPRFPGLQTRRAVDWSAAVPGYGAQILHFPLGEGQVTVVAGLFSRLNNDQIGEHDHAELLATLIENYRPNAASRIVVVTRMALPSLWRWLAESAWMALIAGGALLALWLWHIIPRFGPARPDPAPERRQLREHLTAMGRYLWRSGGRDYWMATCREAFQSRLALRHPALAALPPGEQAAALARLTERPASAILTALRGPTPTAHAFVAAVRTLRNLERLV